MRKLLFLLLFIPLLANAQLGIFKKYTDIPAAPALTTPTTIVPGDFCCGGGIYNYSLLGGFSAGGDGIFNGNFSSGLSLREFRGDATHIYRFTNAAGAIMGGVLGAQPGVGMTDFGNYIRLYGLSVAEPMVVKGERGVGGFVAEVGGADYVLRNIVAKGTGASGFQANGSTSGGSFYSSWVESYCRSFSAGQEGLCYLGLTSPGFASFSNTSISHCFSINSTREGMQIEHHDNVNVRNVTAINSGTGALAAQDGNFQIEDSNGRLSYFIYDAGRAGAWIFTHGFEIDHGYISMSSAAILIGRTDTQYFAGSSRLNGDTLRIHDLCIKDLGTPQNFIFDIQERNAPIKFSNITIDGASLLWQDNRVPGFTNTITGAIGDHGNGLGTCATPTYSGAYNDPDNYAYQGLVIGIYRDLGYGYRSVNINP